MLFHKSVEIRTGLETLVGQAQDSQLIIVLAAVVNPILRIAPVTLGDFLEGQ